MFGEEEKKKLECINRDIYRRWEKERKTEIKIVEMKKLRKRERERLNDKEK